MIARIASTILVGVEARLVEVQVDVSKQGLPGTQTVGLPGTAVRESQERVRIAIRNSGLAGEPARITVNLAPADLPKQGSSLDLAVAVGVLLAEMGQQARPGWVVAGELALDGTLRPIAGALPMALAARAAGSRGILLPQANAAEAGSIGGISVAGVPDLASAHSFMTGERDLERFEPPPYEPEAPSGLGEDLAEVRGQAGPRRALEIAAAGGHHLVLIGPPGTGKTMLARRLRTILPPLTLEEAIEITRVASAAGVLPPGSGLARVRPFRAPHHSITAAGLVGGGADLRPGEVSLAHEGVLFLDELPEFDRRILDLLRQPIENGSLTIVRNRYRITLPSRFLLVAGMNPCPRVALLSPEGPGPETAASGLPTGDERAGGPSPSPPHRHGPPTTRSGRNPRSHKGKRPELGASSFGSRPSSHPSTDSIPWICSLRCRVVVRREAGGDPIIPWSSPPEARRPPRGAREHGGRMGERATPTTEGGEPKNQETVCGSPALP